MTNSDSTTCVREAVGIFINAQHLKDAVRELLAAGFKEEELGLLASEQVVARALGDFYTRTNRNQDSATAPEIAFIGRESSSETGNTLGGSLVFAGTTSLMGAVVASSAIFGGALLVALGGLAGVGVIGALVGTVIHQSDADYLQQQVDEGHMLLFVRMADVTREQQVLDLLSRNFAVDIKMYDIPVKRLSPTATAA